MAFGFERKKTDAPLSHWFTVPPASGYSTDEFYSEIEKELKARQVPGLTITRVEFSEGGLLSDKRVYLRMIRERLVFDVCAAPFGGSFFFSIRFAEIPKKIEPWQIVLCLVSGAIVAGLTIKILGVLLGAIVFVVALVGSVWTLRNAISLGLEDLDAALIRSPILGPLYERYLRVDSYYRIDTRLIYQQVVSEIVREKIDEITAAKGVTLLRAYECNPILDGLYKPVTIHPGARAR